MMLIIKMTNGETLKSDEETFQNSLDSMTSHDMIVQTPEEIALALIESIKSFLLAIGNGVSKMGQLQIKIDGVQTHVNADKVNYIQVIGAEDWLRDAMEYGETVFTD